MIWAARVCISLGTAVLAAALATDVPLWLAAVGGALFAAGVFCSFAATAERFR